ncbi:type III PLP-dependent enzyme [Paenibacillus sp. J22TS3]|uniref:type III PLP-dependent enzyme n=1 Tax=Paenibacillus sp. J22TS3 TaxID=2807192 RepID=UPI001B2D2AB5|nr:type III PLP-dependent enzyme [Paenibacillus sp. J22TS3]GIP23229.1 staphyloferrin B biosynthesis decarboxylase SbnH [Paenibacillus sp. J22TS3]
MRMEAWAHAAKEWAGASRRHSRTSVETSEPVCAFVYDLQGLRKHVSDTVGRLPAYCRMYYAMKANSDARLLTIIRPGVHGFEAASIGEVRKAREVDPDVPVIFGGPGKTDGELQQALLFGVERIHVESLHELRRLCYFADTLGLDVTILLRVNLPIELPQATLQMGGRATQFGMQESELHEAAAILAGQNRVRMAGFHLHNISNQLDAKAHLQLMERYITWSRQQREQFGLSKVIVNAGGGIGVNYKQLDRQFDWYRFTEGLKRIGREHAEGVQLDFECGRYLTAFCGVYVTEVLDIKRNYNKAFAILRGGTQHFRLPVSWKHNHPFEVVPVESWPFPFPRPGIEHKKVTLVGQLCTPKDVFATDEPVRRLQCGDLVLFVLAGAYGWTISHHDFLSHPHPDMVYY